MCGIAAVWGENSPDLAQTIAKRIAHRGPDGHGSLSLQKQRLTLAHRRLAIIDPAGGQQPLVAPQQEGALVANGMIYNDRALRALHSEDHFSTVSDSESILLSCLRRGSSAVSDLDGMFAFVMARRDTVIAARDPLGIKPLYVGKRGNTFCFASEIKALLPVAEEILEFPPGHLFDSQRGLQSYYTLPEATDDLSRPANAVAEIRHTLTQAIEKRMRSDVPLGIFLSGGLDSSIIAAVASKLKPGLKSFSVGLPGSPDLAAARRVATHLGTEHYEYELSREEVMRDLPRILYHLESFDQELVRSAIPCYYVSRLAAQHVKVVLTGEGADELFAGYTYHKSYDDLDALQAELRRSVLSMHDINLQRVDRMSMAHGLEARVPFLDREMLALAFRVPAALKLPRDNGTEKWILRKAFEDLLPTDIVWRDKVQFDQGSGMAAMLETDVATKASMSTSTELPGRARSEEEAFYRNVLIDQFEEPAKLLELVAHWDDDRRVDDSPRVENASVLALGPRAKVDIDDGGAGLGDFSALYDQRSPRPYFRRMAELEYSVPGGANRVFEWCIDELHRVRGTAKLKVLDLCAGYGINGALLKLDISLDELYRYFAHQNHTVDSTFFDRLYFAPRRRGRDPHVVSLDVAASALDYAKAVGFANETHAVNLETEALTPSLRAVIGQCSLICITGGFSFIGTKTFEKILSAFPRCSASNPWIVGFPLLHTDLDQLFELLRDYGYAIQSDSQRRCRQRRFANEHERVHEHAALARAGLERSDDDYFESRLFVAQPPGMPAVPHTLIRQTAALNGCAELAVSA